MKLPAPLRRRLTSNEMNRATIADPHPVTKTTPMKIAQTFSPGYLVVDLGIRSEVYGRGCLKLLETDYAFSPNQRTSCLQTIH